MVGTRAYNEMDSPAPSGVKCVRLKVCKQGDKYPRMLMIHGTRAVLAVLKDKQVRTSQWLQEMIVRRGYKRTAVALPQRLSALSGPF